MKHLLVRHKIADFERWKQVFDANEPAAEAAGLELKRMFRDAEEPTQLFLLFAVRDEDKARAFMSMPEASEAKDRSGVLDEPDCYFLDEVQPS